MIPFLVAVQFLTLVPVSLKQVPNEQVMGRSVLYYPLVGLLIGLFLAALAWLPGDVPAGLQAALILVCWVGLTGGLHLDGLADSADAWVGGLGDPERTLAIMKDPCCGPAAVVSLVLLLLIKFVAIEYIITTQSWEILVLAPVLGRASLILLFLTTPYVRSGGLGALLVKHLSRRAGITIVVLTLFMVPLFMGTVTLWWVFLPVLAFILLRILMLRRIGGMTGDTAGATLEIIELLVLLMVLGSE